MGSGLLVRAGLLCDSLEHKVPIEGTRAPVRGVARDLAGACSHRCYKLVEFRFFKMIHLAQRRAVGLPPDEVVVFVQRDRAALRGLVGGGIGREGLARQSLIAHELPK